MNGSTSTSSEEGPTQGVFSEWKKKLNTKDDPIHVHKTLGILCLASFIFRLGQYGESDMGFKSHPEWTLPTIVLHLLLNLSSFEFHIPPKRIDSGYRIWPEYRLHSLVFLCRSLALMAVNWYELHYSLKPNYTSNLVIVLATIAAADLGSIAFGSKYQSGFARNLDVPNYIRYFFSVMQFYATSGCLYGMRQNAMPFIFVIIIQGNAFLMTLRRKNLASHKGLIAIYGAALFIGWLIGHEIGEAARRVVGTIAHLVLIFRLAPWPASLRPLLGNKYVLWTCAAVLMRKLQPLDEEVDMPEAKAMLTLSQVRVIHNASIVAMVALGWHKCKNGYKSDSKSKESNGASKKVD